MEEGKWVNQQTLYNKRFTCGHCGEQVSSNIGYKANSHQGYAMGQVYICHACNKPTYFSNGGSQTPGVLLGGSIDHLPQDIDKLYDEIRNAAAVNSFTAAVLSSRKLLMHIAVELGAEGNKKFVEYVNYLVDNHYAPPNSKSWIDEIRQAGNEANHEIIIMDSERAKSIIKLIEMLLKFNYEFPAEGATTKVESD